MKKLLFAVCVVILAGNIGFAQCTCQAGCSSLTDITIPFSKDGAGIFCFRATCLGDYINSWNLDTLQINGRDMIIGYIAAPLFPPPMADGYYYIYMVSSVAWGHLEIMGTCTPATPVPTDIQTDTPFPTPNDWIIITPDPTDNPTATPAPTDTPPPTAVPTATPVATPVSTEGADTTPDPTAGPTATCLPCTTNLYVYVKDAVTGEWIQGACVVNTSYCTNSSGYVMLPGQPTCEAGFTATVTVSADGYETQTISGTFSCGGSVLFNLVPVQ